PHDLHVLGTPPAFVLSQDQTLHENGPILTHLFLPANYELVNVLSY
ncbi:MAG: hypothetical protein XD68_1444, partial [Synergistales bacterium 54_24]